METKGFIDQVLFYDLGSIGRGFCVWLRSSPDEVELFTRIVEETDDHSQRDVTVGMMSAVTSALAGHRPITVIHKDTSGVIDHLGLSSG